MAYLSYFPSQDAYLALSKTQGGVAFGSIVGKTFWVDSANTSAQDIAGKGTFTAPFATIAFAETETVASRGDVILVMASHSEVLLSSNPLVISNAGVSVVGLMWGNKKPLITASERIRLVGSGQRFSNFQVSISGTIANDLFQVNGSGCEVTNNIISVASATDVAQNSIITCTSTDALVADNMIALSEATNAADYGIKVSGDRPRILNNYVYGAFDQASAGCCIQVLTSVKNADVRGNFLVNTENSMNCVRFEPNTTGIFSNNHGYNTDAVDGNAVFLDASAEVSCNQNFFTNDFTTSGIIIPAV